MPDSPLLGLVMAALSLAVTWLSVVLQCGHIVCAVVAGIKSATAAQVSVQRVVSECLSVLPLLGREMIRELRIGMRRWWLVPQCCLGLR